LGDDGGDDEELAQTTIFPFVIGRDDRLLSSGDCRKIYRALGRDARGADAASGHEVAAKNCLVGQPVALGDAERDSVAALRICAGARLVTETWSSDDNTARGNLQRELGRVGAIVSRIEWLVAHLDSLDSTELCHET
jgi:hypothetical protein